MTTVVPSAPNLPDPRPFPSTYVDPADVAAYEQEWQARDAAEQAVIDEQAARIAELEAQVDPVPEPDPLPVLGINASNKAQHDSNASIYGSPPPFAWRYYHQPGEAATYPSEYALLPGEGFVYSTKIKAPTVASRVALYRSVPDGVDFVDCPWHEPENDIKSGAMTAAEYRSWFTACRQARDQVGNPRIKIAAILMGYTWQAGSGRNPEDYVPADADFDLLLTDTYFAGTIGLGVDKIPTGYDGVIGTAQRHGKAWGAAECGVGQKVTGQARLDALRLMGATIREKGGLYAVYFSTSQTGEWALSPAEATAWKAGVLAV